MKLEGVHHVTCITGDAPANLEFYAGTLGLRMVKKTVNQDDPTVYHLFYADEKGSAAPTSRSSSIPARRRAAQATGWCIASLPRRLRGVTRLLAEARRRRARIAASLVFDDPEGLDAPTRRRRHRRAAARSPTHPEIPEEHALRGFAGVRAYASRPDASASLLDGLASPARTRLGGARRQAHGFYIYDEPPAERGLPGAGTVHHVAWASTIEEHDAWREEGDRGGRATRPR